MQETQISKTIIWINIMELKKFKLNKVLYNINKYFINNGLSKSNKRNLVCGFIQKTTWYVKLDKEENKANSNENNKILKILY